MAAFGLQRSAAMVRLAGLLLVVLGSLAAAEPAEAPATPPKPQAAQAATTSTRFPFRVVKILPDSEQALVFDKNRGRHVLVEVGDMLGDYTVTAIARDEVTLAGKDVPVEVVLGVQARTAKPATRPVDADDDDAAPEDPYAEPRPAKSAVASSKRAPADPYAEEADEESIREVRATEQPPAPIRATPWGAPSSPSEGEGAKSTTSPFASSDRDAAKPTDEVAKRGPTSATEQATPAANAPAKLTRKEVNAALADFGALAASIEASFTAAGLELSKVKPGSVFAKAGLTAGDLVTAVDGKPLRTLDDAAELYARAGTIKRATVQLVRGGKPQALRVVIQ